MTCWGQVFGGQVLGQALSAAVQTVPADRHVHSLHSYFLRPGAVDKPIVYQVDRLRDGGSFTTRRAVAVQDGAPIFNMSASFQGDEGGFEHAAPMPRVPGPEGLKNERELWAAAADRLPEETWARARALGERPIELRPVEPVDVFAPDAKDPSPAADRPRPAPLPACVLLGFLVHHDRDAPPQGKLGGPSAPGRERGSRDVVS